MKLKIELVPKGCWGENLRKVLPKTDWDKIRRNSYAKAGNKCEICAAVGKLNCHEIWEYDDKNNIQLLKGFQALCDNCHNIKHIGFVSVQISDGRWPKETLSRLKNHFSDVNGVRSIEFERHVNEAFKMWHERSKKKWTTKLGEYENYSTKTPSQKSLSQFN